MAHHSLWELHGKHNIVYILGSIHVLRPADYPLAPEVLDAYAHSRGLVMEINLGDVDATALQSELLAGALLPDARTLPQVMGVKRYGKATQLARAEGIDLARFDQFAPWFAAEAITQAQLSQLGFAAQSGVEMYFLDRAQQDHKSIAGLETVQDQIGLFQGLSLDAQSDYLVTSLAEAHELPHEVDAMVRAWQHGDVAWFTEEMKSEFGDDPVLYQSLLVTRNRKWLPKIEALLNEDGNYLVIVGTGHLLQRSGFTAVQR
jgi:uncharacterized protein YbaP (TraB family)